MTPRLFLECWQGEDASDRDGDDCNREWEVCALNTVKRAHFVRVKFEMPVRSPSRGISSVAGGSSKLERDQERGERPYVAMEIAGRVWGLPAGTPCAAQIIQHYRKHQIPCQTVWTLSDSKHRDLAWTMAPRGHS